MNAKTKNIVAWLLSVLVGGYLIIKGIPKIMPSPGMVRFFVDWGYNETFLRMLGIAEVAGGLLLFIPRMAFYGGVLLSGILVGASYTVISSGKGGPLEPILFLVLSLGVSYFRFGQRLGSSKGV